MKIVMTLLDDGKQGFLDKCPILISLTETNISSCPICLIKVRKIVDQKWWVESSAHFMLPTCSNKIVPI